MSTVKPKLITFQLLNDHVIEVGESIDREIIVDMSYHPFVELSRHVVEYFQERSVCCEDGQSGRRGLLQRTRSRRGKPTSNFKSIFGHGYVICSSSACNLCF